MMTTLCSILLAFVTQTSTVTWHNADIAPWYGPGFYGSRTACGQKMTRELRGVAHRTLKCGTKVRLKWHGIYVTVPVVDRGPYPRRSLRDNMPFDLTAGTAKMFKEYRGQNPYFTRYNMRWRIVH